MLFLLLRFPSATNVNKRHGNYRSISTRHLSRSINHVRMQYRQLPGYGAATGTGDVVGTEDVDNGVAVGVGVGQTVVVTTLVDGRELSLHLGSVNEF